MHCEMQCEANDTYLITINSRSSIREWACEINLNGAVAYNRETDKWCAWNLCKMVHRYKMKSLEIAECDRDVDC